MIVKEKVLKTASFSRERWAYDWLKDNYPDGIDPTINHFLGDWNASVYVMEDVEYTDILVSIEYLEDRIKTLKQDCKSDYDNGEFDKGSYGKQCVYKFMESLLENSKKVK